MAATDYVHLNLDDYNKMKAEIDALKKEKQEMPVDIIVKDFAVAAGILFEQRASVSSREDLSHATLVNLLEQVSRKTKGFNFRLQEGNNSIVISKK